MAYIGTTLLLHLLTLHVASICYVQAANLSGIFLFHFHLLCSFVFRPSFRIATTLVVNILN
jgi:hypothetical protein